MHENLFMDVFMALLTFHTQFIDKLSGSDIKGNDS